MRLFLLEADPFGTVDLVIRSFLWRRVPAAVDNEQTVLNFGVRLLEVEDIQNGDGHPIQLACAL
jgi:hypothetical protein